MASRNAILHHILILVTLCCVTGQDEFSTVKYMGCYSVDYAENRELGQVIHPLSWESCILLCTSKAARYAGLVLRKRMCYCGSYLIENSNTFPSRDCLYSCSGESRRSCGGDRKMTVYKLKEDTLSRVLIGTKSGIFYVNNNKRLTNLIAYNLEITSVIRHHYKNNEIYFSQKTIILRSTYSTTTHQYKQPNVVVRTQNNDCACFALDWVNNKLYYKDNDLLWESNLNGSNTRQLQGVLAKHIYQFEIDPYERKLFCYHYHNENTNNAIKAYSLDLKVESTITTSCPSYTCYLTSYDTHTQSLYSRSDRTLFKIDYSGNRVFLHSSYSLRSICKATTAEDNNLVYSESPINNNGVWNIHIVRVTGGEVTAFMNSERVYCESFTLVHEVIQAPTKKVACLKFGCSHECEYSPKSVARCVCPSTMQLDITERHCRKLRTRRDSRDYSDCDDYDDCSTRSYSKEYSSEYSTRQDSSYYSKTEEESQSYEESNS